jgi:sugar O-acyltransferase (sialic acid O-acetyltransferase NeuD family)
MKKIIIFGTGSHSKVVFSEIVKYKDYSVLGFVDGYLKKGKLIEVYKNKKYKNLGTIRDIKKLKKIYGVIAVGRNYLRKKIFHEVKSIAKDFKWATIISKNSIINSNVKIGEGSVIISNSIINTGTKIGKHCLINTSSSLDHDNNFDDFSSTGPGVTTGGNVEVGKMSHLSIGCTIKNNIKIESNTIIGASSFVNKDCNKNSVYYGVPAKKIRFRTESEDDLK